MAQSVFSTSPLIFARLVALSADAEQKEYWLETNLATIGRLAAACTIVINRQPISRIHAQIERRGSHYVLRNLGRNGTYVNGTLISDDHILQHGDKIGLATEEPLFTFSDSDPTVVPHVLFRYDEATLTFFLHEQALELTPTLFRLLLHLYRNRGKICTREECARAVWQNDYLPEYETDNLDKAIFALRQRLRKIDATADFIQIRRSFGYLLNI